MIAAYTATSMSNVTEFSESEQTTITSRTSTTKTGKKANISPLIIYRTGPQLLLTR